MDTLRGQKILVLDPSLVGTLSLIAEARLLLEHGVSEVHQTDREFDLPSSTPIQHVLFLVRPNLSVMRAVVEHVRNLTSAIASKASNAANSATSSSGKSHKRGAKHKKDTDDSNATGDGDSSSQTGGSDVSIHVYGVPRMTLVCERMLEEAGVLGDVHIGQFELDLVPIDDDILSMELPQAFREEYLDGDHSVLYYAAQAIMKLQGMFGPIPSIKAKGRAAKDVYDMVVKMGQLAGLGSMEGNSEIDSLILIDRQIDMISPLMTQLTYEGLIDEVFGIDNGMLDISGNQIPGMNAESKSSQEQQKKTTSKRKKLPLNFNDRVFAEIRDLPITAVGRLLKQRILDLNEAYEKRHGLQTVKELKDFVGNLPYLQEEHTSVTNHTNIAHEIKNRTTSSPEFVRRVQMEQAILMGDDKEALEYIEDCIDRQESLTKVLRMLCLLSVVNNGLKQKVFEPVKLSLIQTYGYDVLLTLFNLEKCGLLRQQEQKSTWPQISKTLQCMVTDMDDAAPKDIAYVFSIYAPISVRLVEASCFKPGGWRSIEPALAVLSGPGIVTEPGTKSAASSTTASAASASATASPSSAALSGSAAGATNTTATSTSATSSASASGRRKVALVFFLGGCTLAEISALRFLSSGGAGSGGNNASPSAGSGAMDSQEGGWDFVVATTKLIRGDALVQSLFDVVGRMGFLIAPPSASAAASNPPTTTTATPAAK